MRQELRAAVQVCPRLAALVGDHILADPASRMQAYASEDFRGEFHRMIDGGALTDAFAKAVVSYSRLHPEYQERLLPELAAQKDKRIADFVAMLARGERFYP